MSIASGLVVAGRRRVRTRMPARVVVHEKPSVETRARSTHLGEMARGVAWAVVLLVACALSSVAVAVVVGTAAAIASLSAVRAIPRPRNPVSLAVAVGGPVVAAVCFVIADLQSANLALVLALAICFYDAGCYINGNGREAGGWLGIAAGLLAVGVLTVFVAAVLVPPFTGFTPWLVMGVTALLAPVGVWFAGRATSWERAPALRRVDSMILAAPVWVILAATVLQR